jgi:hypothetical protein
VINIVLCTDQLYPPPPTPPNPYFRTVEEEVGKTEP